jgi:hypothetical protein
MKHCRSPEKARAGRSERLHRTENCKESQARIVGRVPESHLRVTSLRCWAASHSRNTKSWGSWHPKLRAVTLAAKCWPTGIESPKQLTIRLDSWHPKLRGADTRGAKFCLFAISILILHHWDRAGLSERGPRCTVGLGLTYRAQTRHTMRWPDTHGVPVATPSSKAPPCAPNPGPLRTGEQWRMRTSHYPAQWLSSEAAPVPLSARRFQAGRRPHCLPGFAWTRAAACGVERPCRPHPLGLSACAAEAGRSRLEA